jgi:dTDP-4-dehydrorhamnose reductase
MNILLIGRAGQVAHELRRTLACLGTVTCLDRHTPLCLDLARPDSIRAAVRQVKPDLIVNAAAYTAVDRAETETAQAHAVNATAPGLLAEAALGVGAGLIHYSTDYVFPGTGSQPYREDDATGPTNVYGESKLAGERAITEVGVPHYILRTAWVYGLRGQNFLLTMRRLMREREVLRVVDDQNGAPTWSRLIAEATSLMIADSRRDGRFEPEDRSGLYHLTSTGVTTWFGFAAAIRDLGIDHGLLSESCARLEPIPTRDYPTPARRPAWSVLDTDKLASRFGLRLPAWDDALALCLSEACKPAREGV